MPRGVYPRKSVEERFWAKVAKSDDPDGCWIWTGAKHRWGYGLFTINGIMEGAHRISWRWANGPIPLIPDGLWVLHNCPGGDNPSCVNPAHLWLGTTQENTADRDAKGRVASGDRHGSVTCPGRLPRGDDHFRRKHPELVYRGEAHGMAKLTWDRVREMRRRAAAGESVPRLATEFGISHSHACKILRNEAWIE